MKKYFKILFIFIMSLSLVVPFEAFASSKMVINSKKSYSYGSRSTSKYSTNKGTGYCVKPGAKGPAAGSKLSYYKTVKSGKLVYLLDHANSNGFIVTQLAVWKVYNGNNRYKEASSSYKSKAASLISKANKNSNYSTKPSISISPASSSLTLKGDYYMSPAYKLSVKNITSKISVTLSGAPSNTKIVDGNGKVKSTFKGGETFYVRVPYASVTKDVTFTITVKGSGKTTVVKIYKPSSSDKQNIAVLVKESDKDDDKSTLKIKKVDRSCLHDTKTGKYFDKNGKETDKTTYSIQCEKHYCDQIGNKYFGKAGNEVTAEQFDIECNKHVCKPIGDKYFGKDGTEVTKEEYEDQCLEKHYCEPVDDKFFGKDGTEVTEEQYDLECNTHICKPVGDKFFGKDGTEVTEEQYDLECNTHVCEPVGDKFFGKDGNEVTKEEYEDQCFEKHYCEKVDDKYFGKDGNEVTEQVYNSECVHKCEIYDNKYFGKDGLPTTEEDFKAQCEQQIVPVPDTSDNKQILYVLLGALLLAGTFVTMDLYANRKIFVK